MDCHYTQLSNCESFDLHTGFNAVLVKKCMFFHLEWIILCISWYEYYSIFYFALHQHQYNEHKVFRLNFNVLRALVKCSKYCCFECYAVAYRANSFASGFLQNFVWSMSPPPTHTHKHKHTRVLIFNLWKQFERMHYLHEHKASRDRMVKSHL